MKIHSSHLGIETWLRRASECIYWPDLSAEMKQYFSACETCREFDSMTHAKETLMSHEIPSRPWEKIATDIFTLDGKDYLVTIDYYSNFWEVDRLPNTKASTTILKLKGHFARYGIPDQVISDNGPQFTFDEFANFARTWEFEHLISSPGNSKVSANSYLAVLEYRNTTTRGMTASPGQRLMSQRTKTLLPSTQSLLLPWTINLESEKKELRER